MIAQKLLTRSESRDINNSCGSIAFKCTTEPTAQRTSNEGGAA